MLKLHDPSKTKSKSVFHNFFATVLLEVMFIANLMILSVRRDSDKPNTSILGVPPEASIIGVSSRNSLFCF